MCDEGVAETGGGINQTGTRRYRGIQNRRKIARVPPRQPPFSRRAAPRVRQAKDLRAADYFPIIYPCREREVGRGVAVFREGRSVPVLLVLGRARTDTIAAINTGEQPLTSPGEGPILYFISKLIPRDQIYCKKGVKKYTFVGAHPLSLSLSLSLSLGYLPDGKVTSGPSSRCCVDVLSLPNSVAYSRVSHLLTPLEKCQESRVLRISVYCVW